MGGSLFVRVSACASNVCVSLGGPCSALPCMHSPLPQGRVSLSSFVVAMVFFLWCTLRTVDHAHVSIVAAPSYPLR